MRKFITLKKVAGQTVRILLIIVVCFLSVHSAKSQCAVHASNDTAVCLNAPLSLTATVTNSGGTITSVVWTTVPPTVPTIGNTLTVPTTAAGTFTYVATANLHGGCTATDTLIADTVVVIVNPLPVASFTFNPNNECGSVPVNFLNTSSGVGLSYSWNFGDPNSGTLNTSTATNPPGHHFVGTPGTGTQNFLVKLVVTSSSGCKDSITQQVTIKQSPGTELGGTGPTTINGIHYFRTCSTSSSAVFNFVNLSSTATTNVNYTIIWGDASPNFTATNFSSTISHTYGTGTHTLLFIVTGAAPNLCTDTATYYVFVGSNPAVGLNNPGNTTICSGTPLTFPITGTSTNPPGTTYIVTFNDGGSVGPFNQPPPPDVTYTFNTTSCGTTSSDGTNSYPNSFSAVIVASNPCNHSSSGVVPIYVSQKPEASFIISPNDTVCINNPVTLTNTSLNGNSVENGVCTPGKAVWSISPATGYTYIGTTGTDNGSSDPDLWAAGSNILQLTFTTIGTYTIKLKTGGNSRCANDSIIKTICVNEIPVAAFTINQNTGCAPLNVTTNNNSSFSNCGSNTFKWSVTYAPTAGCTPIGSLYSYINGTDSISQNPQFQFTNPGFYTISLTTFAPGGACSSTAVTQQITVNAKPNVTLNVPVTICQNQSFNPTATSSCFITNATTYNWSFPSGTPTTAPGQNPPGPVTYYNPGTFNVSVDVTNACGTTTVVSPLTVLATPLANAGNDISICSGGSTQLGAAPVAGLTYSWSPATGLNSGVAANPILTLTNPGSTPVVYTYILTVTNSNNCSSKDTVLVTVNPLPVISVNPPSVPICIGSNTLLTANGADTYSWSPATGLSAITGTTVTANPITTTTYTVTGTVTATGCYNSTSVTVTVNQLPVVNAGPDQTVCNQPIPVQLTGSPAGGIWSGANITSGGLFTPNGVSSFPVVYTFINGNNCTNTDTAIITVINPTNANAGSDTAVCLNSGTVQFNGSPSGGNWTGINITAGGLFTPSLAGSFNLIYTFGSGTCLTKDTVVVTVNPLPIVSINPSSVTICIGNSTLLTASGADTYSWSPAAGLNTTSGAAVTASPVITTTYTVTGSITATGCSKSTTVTVTVNPLPAVNAGADQTVCNQPIPVQLTGTPLNGTWSGLNITSGGLFTPNGVGSFPVVYTFTNSNGCTNTDTAIITVIDPTNANAGADTAVCLNSGTVQFNGSPSGGSWTGTNITSTGLFTSSLAGSLNLIYTFGSGTCLTKDTVVITVNPLPVVSITPSSAAICIGNNTLLTASGADTYSWSPAAGLNTTSGAAVTASPVTTTTYTVTGTITATGCNKSTTATVTVNPLPAVNAGADQTVCNQPIPVQLTGTPLNGTWSGLNITSGGLFTPNGVGSFPVVYTFTNSNGCTNTDTAIITVIDPTNANAGADTAVCLNSGTVQFNGSPSGGSWTGTNITSTGLFTPSLAGSLNLIYTFGSGTCLTKDTVVITVNPLPVVSITPSSAAICIGNNTLLTASGADTYSWSPAAGLNTTSGAAVTASPVTTTTYTVTGTITATGCNKSTTATVTVNPLPVVNAGPDQTLCNQLIPVQLTGSPSGGSWSGANISSGGLFTPNGVGSFPVVYTFTNGNNCTNTDTAIITVIDATNANAGADTAVCLNSGSVLFTGIPSGGTWTGTNIISTGLFTPSIAGTFNLVYTFGGGTCLTRDTAVVIVNPLPVVSITPSSAVICIGNSTLLTASGANTYSWSPATGLSAATGATVTANPVITTTYTVTGTITTTGCNKSANVTVIVNPDSKALFTADSNHHCAPFNLNTVIHVTPFPDRNAMYHWYANGTEIAGSPNTTGVFPGFTISTPGDTVIIKLVTTSQYGCKSDSMQIQFTTVVTAIANFTKDKANGCAPLLVTFTNTSSILNNTIQYFWVFGNGTFLNTTNPGPVTATYSNNPNFIDTTYYITLKVFNGCDTTYKHDSVTVFPNSKARFGVDTTRGCSPFTIHITNTSPGNNFNYYWDFGDGTKDTTHTLGSFTHIYHTGIIVNDTIRLISENQCSRDTQRITIVVSPNNITAAVNANGNELSGCAPHSVTFINGSAGAAQLTWLWGDGTPLETTPNNQSTINHVYNSPGNYTVTIHLLNDCSDTVIYRTVIVYAPPTANITVTPIRVCTDQSVTVTNTSTSSNSAELYWGDTSPSIPILTGETKTHLYTIPGPYTITLVAKRVNPAGFVCTDTTRKPITVVDMIPAQINVAPGKRCVPYTLTVNAGSISGYDLVEWVIYDNSSTPGIFHFTGLAASHIYTVPGIDSVKLIVHTTSGCADSSTYRFPVFNTPQSSFSPTPVITCSHDTTITFTAATTSIGSNPVNYQWFINGSIQGNTNPFSYHFSAGLNNTLPIEFSVKVLAQNAEGCGDTSVAGKVIIQPLPFPKIQVTPSVVLSQPDYTFTFKDTAATNPNKNYLWDMGESSLTTRTGREITYEYGHTGTYRVRLFVTDFTTGCKAQDFVNVTILFVPGSLYVPNAFYPNSRINQLKTFLPAGIGLEKYHLQIFDAWGKMVFETKELSPDGSPKFAWDGSFNGSTFQNNGKPLSQDAYVWKIVEAKFKNGKDWEGMSYNGGPPRRFGTLTLFR